MRRILIVVGLMAVLTGCAMRPAAPPPPLPTTATPTVVASPNLITMPNVVGQSRGCRGQAEEARPHQHRPRYGRRSPVGDPAAELDRPDPVGGTGGTAGRRCEDRPRLRPQ